MSQVDFYSALSGLGDTIAANRSAAAKREAFAQATTPGPDGTVDFQRAILGLAQVDPQAAGLLANRANHADTLKQQGIQNERQAKQDQFNQYVQNENLKISRANLANNSEGPEETASQRAAAATTHGIKPNTPEFKSYVLTGKLPEGDTSIVDAVNQRKLAAEANGMKPDNPGYQSFIMTGKMPREDAQPLTAGDKEAIRVADDAVISNRAAIDSMNRAKGLSKTAFSGPAAGKGGYFASFLGESSDLGKKGIATENLTNEVMTNALGQLKAIFGGNPTEGERKILLDLQGSVSRPDSVRQAIFDRAIAAAKNRLDFNQKRADELRGGSYYKTKQPGAAVAEGGGAPGVVPWQTYFGSGQ